MKQAPITGTTRTDAPPPETTAGAVEQQPDAGEESGDAGAIQDRREHRARQHGGREAGDELAPGAGKQGHLRRAAI